MSPWYITLLKPHKIQYVLSYSPYNKELITQNIVKHMVKANSNV